MHPEHVKQEIFINKQNKIDSSSMQQWQEEVLPILFTLQVLSGSQRICDEERALLDEVIVRLRRLAEQL